MWKCVEPTCKVQIKEVDVGEWYKEMVRTHLATHVPAGSDKSRRKDLADWTAMEKWPADRYPLGQMSTAEFNDFEKLISVILNEVSADERNSTRTKHKVLNKMEALPLRGLEDHVTNSKVTTDGLLKLMREVMVSPRNWCKSAWEATVMKQGPGESVRNFIEKKEKMVKSAGLPWSGDEFSASFENMLKYTVIYGITNERLKTKIFDDAEVGNNAIREAKWEDVKARLIMLDISMDMQEDKPTDPTVNRLSKTSYKRNQRFGKKNTGNTSDTEEGKCHVCRVPGHYARDCPLKCTLKGCNRGRWHELTKEHMTEVMNKKKSSGNRQPGRKRREMSVNQVKETDSDSESTSETSDSESASDASVLHIHRIRKNGDQMRATQSDPDAHPKLKVTFKLDPESYKVAGHRRPRVARGTTTTSTKAICDTGANICLMSRRLFEKLNAPVNSLRKAPTAVRLADRSSRQLTEMCILKIEAKVGGEEVSTVQQVYLCGDAKTPLYLSKRALIELGVISPDFPQPGPRPQEKYRKMRIQGKKRIPGPREEDRKMRTPGGKRIPKPTEENQRPDNPRASGGNSRAQHKTPKSWPAKGPAPVSGGGHRDMKLHYHQRQGDPAEEQPGPTGVTEDNHIKATMAIATAALTAQEEEIERHE